MRAGIYRYLWRENVLQVILCYTKIGLTPSYWNYLPVPRVASKPAVLQAFSLVTLAIRRLRSETGSTRFDIHQSKRNCKGAVPQLHVQIDYDKGREGRRKKKNAFPAFLIQVSRA